MLKKDTWQIKQIVACRNIFNTIRMSGHGSLEKYTPHFIRKGYERYYVWEVSWRLNRTATYWPLNSSGYSSISFPFSRSVQPGASGPSLYWDMVIIQATFSNWSEFPVTLGYIIIWHPPTSCERDICTQFNPSTVKVITWYLRPDSPVIYTGAFLLWQPGRVGVSMLQNEP